MPRREDVLKANKAAVVRFNREVIEQGNEDSFRALMAPSFVHHTAAPGMSAGPDGSSPSTGCCALSLRTSRWSFPTGRPKGTR